MSRSDEHPPDAMDALAVVFVVVAIFLLAWCAASWVNDVDRRLKAVEAVTSVR